MNTVTILSSIKEFLEKQVANNIRLQKDNPSNVYEYELMNPNVFEGWLPPNGYLPEEIKSAIPCIVVGIDEGGDFGDNAVYDIKLSFAVYSPGFHNADGTYTPDFRGYLDLLNLIDLAKANVIKMPIHSKFKLNSDVTWGMYDEQPFPYWYGWMKFKVESMAYPRAEIEKLLN